MGRNRAALILFWKTLVPDLSEFRQRLDKVQTLFLLWACRGVTHAKQSLSSGKRCDTVQPIYGDYWHVGLPTVMLLARSRLAGKLGTDKKHRESVPSLRFFS